MEPVSLSQPVIAPAPAFAGVLGLTRASALVCRCVRSFPVAAQSLPRDLTLSPSGRLLQSWVPELQTMRAYAPQQQGLQLEILARFKINPDNMLTESSSHKQTPRFVHGPRCCGDGRGNARGRRPGRRDCLHRRAKVEQLRCHPMAVSASTASSAGSASSSIASRGRIVPSRPAPRIKGCH